MFKIKFTNVFFFNSKLSFFRMADCFLQGITSLAFQKVVQLLNPYHIVSLELVYTLSRRICSAFSCLLGLKFFIQFINISWMFFSFLYGCCEEFIFSSHRSLSTYCLYFLEFFILKFHDGFALLRCSFCVKTVCMTDLYPDPESLLILYIQSDEK